MNYPNQYEIEEDVTPTDLEFVCSNETAGFVLFKTKGDLYVVYNKINFNSFGKDDFIPRLIKLEIINSRPATEEEAKEMEKEFKKK